MENVRLTVPKLEIGIRLEIGNKIR